MDVAGSEGRGEGTDARPQRVRRSWGPVGRWGKGKSEHILETTLPAKVLAQ